MAASDPPGDGDDKKVKELLDPATQANLMRWFGLPSFEQLADEGKRPALPPEPEEDPKVAERRARMAAAVAAVDPDLLAALAGRAEPARPLTVFREQIDVRVDREFGFDFQLTEQRLAEPRDYERPPDIEDELRHSTPQALLRDLHRVESSFRLELVWEDPLPPDRMAARDTATAVMATRWSLPHRPARSPFLEARELLREEQRNRRKPWTELKLPRRRVTE